MKRLKSAAAAAVSILLAFSLAACGTSGTTASGTAASGTTSGTEASGTSGISSSSQTTSSGGTYTEDTKALTLDNTAWQYDSTNDVYWQIGLGYCSTPATTDYETMGIYVPGKYFTGKVNSDGTTYTCTINSAGTVGDYTASTAPIVFPVNTAGYSAQNAPSSYDYSSISEYLSAGLIYCYAGMRGRDNGYDSSNNLIYSGGAPWGVTDLKAAVRYYRFNSGNLPGDSEKVFTFGHSGGGAQSSLMGATGDSELYTPYLESIGAAMTDASGNKISDAIYGAMCWCPITSLDEADEAYEWNMGQYETSGTRADGTFTAQLSKDLAAAYADYINKLGLKDASGNVLTLDKTDSGVYAAGSYYNYLMGVVETSLNNFLSDTTFPYTENSQTMASGNFGGGGAPSGATGSGTSGMPSDMSGMTGGPSGATGSGTSGMPSDMSGMTGGPSGATGSGTSGMPSGGPGGDTSGSTSSGTTYDSAEDYIASLNSDTQWITYDSATNTASVSSMSAFVTHCKNATKDVGAFDSLSRSQAENNEFGNDTSDSLHFDSILSNLLSTNKDTYSALTNWTDSYPDDYANDIKETDDLGNDVTARVNMYNPMYYLSSYYKGAGTSTVAPYWRIRTGIDQGDTALTVETNLTLALQSLSSVKSVDFATVWGMGHTMAERTGSASANFISWVEKCAKA